MTSKGSAFLSFDGVAVHYTSDLPSVPPQAIWVVVHGFGEHGGRYDEFAARLCSEGYAVYRPDLRGFGQSGGKRGCVNAFEDHFEDLKALLRLIRMRHPGLPLVFLAHSFGALVVSSFLAVTRNACGARLLVLTSPYFGIGFPVPAWRKWSARIFSSLLPDLTQASHLDPSKLTHDAQKLSERGSDALVHDRISARSYVLMCEWMAQSPRTASALNLSCLILQAGDDRIVSARASESFFSQLKSPDKTYRSYPTLYHELLNETHRAAIIQEILDWAGPRLKIN